MAFGDGKLGIATSGERIVGDDIGGFESQFEIDRLLGARGSKPGEAEEDDPFTLGVRPDLDGVRKKIAP